MQFRNLRARGCSAARALLKGPMVSKSCRSRRSKRLTYLEYATNTATTAQLSTQDEDGTTNYTNGCRRQTSVYCVNQLHLPCSAARCALGSTH